MWPRAITNRNHLHKLKTARRKDPARRDSHSGIFTQFVSLLGDNSSSSFHFAYFLDRVDPIAKGRQGGNQMALVLASGASLWGESAWWFLGEPGHTHPLDHGSSGLIRFAREKPAL